jgi:hypothetical protein
MSEVEKIVLRHDIACRVAILVLQSPHLVADPKKLHGAFMDAVTELVKDALEKMEESRWPMEILG